MKLRNNYGITLIALAITITILILLAGVSVNMLLGENGIIFKSKNARVKMKESQNKEKLDLENVDDEIISSLTGTKIIEGVPIPEGFYYVGGVRGKGVVISDSEDDNERYKYQEDVGSDLIGNQWVWVPVEDPSKMFINVQEGINLLGQENVKTYAYSNKIINYLNSNKEAPGSNGFREPDIVKDYDTEKNIKEAGFSSVEEMAKSIVEEYAKMKESIEKHNGFFIGRYELSENGEKKGKPITGNGWHKAYKTCKKLYVSNYATSSMVWGIQWDATCQWIEKSGYDINDSSNWGNYSNNTSEGAGVLQDTGYSESWKANNIYDLAGNCYEITQEASGDEYGRCIRGGYCSYSGKIKSVTELFSSLRPSWVSYDFVATRAILII